MKITSLAHAVFFVTLTSAGLTSIARWLHPATFDITTLWILLTVAFISAAIIILPYD